MKKLIVIRGPLGAGKSTISKILAQELDLEYISLDQLLDDYKLVPENSEGIPLESYLKANQIILDLRNSSQKSFIVDGCFYYQEQIDDIQSKFPDNNEIFTLCSNVETCIERDSKRPKVYGEDSARFVHMITTKIKAGHEIDSTNLTAQETVEEIVKKLSL
jgi:shikimate kinase